jgi:Exocyst complex component Sec5
LHRSDSAHSNVSDTSLDMSRHQKPTALDRMDINHEQFNAKAYVTRMISESRLQNLVNQHDTLRTSVKKLDSDMQMLVYENYNKFISATDMIRKMKTNVESMEDEMQNLLESMEDIRSSCTSVETKLGPNREEVEKLVGVSRLMKRLEFLFELPVRLKQAVEKGYYDQAVQYYTRATAILAKYEHTTSFDKIRDESDEIIERLKVHLRQLLRDSSSSRTIDQMENAALLLRLGEAPEDLLKDVLQSRKIALQAELKHAVERTSAKKAAEQKLEVDADIAAAAAAAAADAAAAAAADDANADADADGGADPDPETKAENELTAVGSGTDIANDLKEEPSAVDSKVDSSPPTSPVRQTQATPSIPNGNVPQLMHELAGSFIGSFLLFAQSFRINFIDPFMSGPSRKPQTAETCQAALVEFTTEIFERVFSLVRDELVECASFPTESTPAVDAEIATSFVENLRTFGNYMSKPHIAVPQANIKIRTDDITRLCIRTLIENVMHRTELDFVQSIEVFHAQLVPSEDLKSADTMLSDYTKTAPLAVRKSLKACIRTLQPIINTRVYLPDPVVREFADQVKVQLVGLVSNMVDILQCGLPRASDGPIFDSIPPSALEHIVGHTNMQHPKLLLVLSKLAHQLEAKELMQVFQHVDEIFPSGTRLDKLKMTEFTTTVLLKRLHETSRTLLAGYVEAHAVRFNKMLRELPSGESTDESGSITSRRSINPVLDALQAVKYELDAIYPVKQSVAMASGAAGGRAAGGRGTSSMSAANRVTSRERSLKRDMDRLFTKRLEIFGEVAPSRASILMGVVKALFKSFLENTRSLQFMSARVLQQRQAEIEQLRENIPVSLSHDQHTKLHQLLAEASSSSGDRCSERARSALTPGNPSRMSRSASRTSRSFSRDGLP